MPTSRDILRSRPALLAGTLGHRYLTNAFILPAEGDCAALLIEQPDLVVEMTAMLHELDGTFLDGYDPAAFVLGLRSFAGIDDNLRSRLLGAVQAEYVRRFGPQARLDDLRARTRAFLGALDAWVALVNPSGPTPTSRPLWVELRTTAESLRALLECPELSKRWIP